MVFDITQLKKIRKRLELTQFQFAKEIGISQSMIAKIEAGKLDPTYSYVKKIERALEVLTMKEELTAGKVMHSKITSVKRDTLIKDIIKIMTTNNISQVPVVEKNNVLGLITETNLLEIKENKVAEEIMQESPPIIDKNAKLSVLLLLLKFYPAVLVKEKEKLVGIITKADILKKLN